MSLRNLNSYIKKHGKAKTAVALGLKETNAINNWIARKSIPATYKEAVKKISHKTVIVETLQESKAV